jgi:RHS repeat-associated protein
MKRWLSLLAYFSIVLCANEYIIPLGDLGGIRYIYDDGHLLQIERLSPCGRVIYTHGYFYDEEGRLISEQLIGDLGTIEYEGDLVTTSPYSIEVCEYDENHNLIRCVQDGKMQEYVYNERNELIGLEDEKVDLKFDLEGNLIRKGSMEFSYDENHRSIEVVSNACVVSYVYDLSGKRISKRVNEEEEQYLYFGSNEIGILDQAGFVKELRIPGLSLHKDLLRPIAIETKDAIYAPIHDVQGNIVKLIDIATKEVICLEKLDPFGRGIADNAPTSWIFAGKHYDPEVGLVYFGSRFYSPDIRIWLTPDPERQTADLYCYCLNNPFFYFDPDGRFAIPLVSLAWGAGATITAPIWAPYAAAAAAGAAIGYFGYKAYKGYQHWQEEHQKEPPFTWEDLGNDATKSPGDGFEWKGRGNPGVGKGKWVRGPRAEKEELYPDFDHPAPIGPHWDYWGPDFPEGIRIKPDGTWEEK